MIELSFYTLSLIVFIMVFFILKGHISFPKYMLFTGLWLAYVFLISKSGILNDYGLPPRVPLLLIIPAIMLILIIHRTAMFKQIRSATGLHTPVLMQSFRILVELLIYATFLKGIFPQRATFEGLNFDILVGISALIIGTLIWKSFIGKKGLLIWNIASLGILSLTAYSFISTYYFTDFAASDSGRKFVEIPYILLASYLLPVAIFLHVFSIKQCLGKEN